MLEHPDRDVIFSSAFGKLTTGSHGNDATLSFPSRVEGIQCLFSVPGMRGTNDESLCAAREKRQSIIAMNENRDRGERRAIRGEQICPDGRATHARDHHLPDILPRRKLMREAKLIGGVKLVWQVVDLIDHV